MITGIPAVPQPGWVERIWQDLQPAPGRLSATLRITLASILTLLVLMTYRIPFASIGLYFVFLVGRDSPAISIRSSVLSSLALALAVALELGVVILSDNDPAARVLSVALVTFACGTLMFGTNLAPLASSLGFIFCTLIATWELHVPAEALVKGSLWLLGAVSVAQLSSIAVEYVFGTQNPAAKLHEQRRARYQAVETLFTLYADGAVGKQVDEAALAVARLAVQGQAGMQDLYNKIVARNLDVGDLPVGARVRITMQAQLMDLAAAFATQKPEFTPEMRQRCALIAEQCRRLRSEAHPRFHEGPEAGAMAGVTAGLLERVEATLHAILSMPTARTGDDKKLVALPSNKTPLVQPGAVTDPAAVAFALKLSLCATICYLFYHAVDWPGISTSVTTVLITGLSNSGAIKQKLIFRVLGSVIGGLILGLGSTAFLFPYMDSITSVVVLVAAVAFVSAWVAAGRRFNYVGLQIAFSFYLVAFEGFSAPTELAPARDRLIGILLALVVMAFVFDQLWPVRTVTAMRHALATVLHGEAKLFRLTDTGQPREELTRQSDALRDSFGKTIAGLRTMNEAVEYEFGVNRDEHRLTGERIVEAALSAAALFWNQVAFLRREEDGDFLKEPRLTEMRARMAGHMDRIAESVVSKTAVPVAAAETFAGEGVLQDPRYGEYARISVARYQELQTAIAGLSGLA